MRNVLSSIQAKRWEGSEVKTISFFPPENRSTSVAHSHTLAMIL